MIIYTILYAMLGSLCLCGLLGPYVGLSDGGCGPDLDHGMEKGEHVHQRAEPLVGAWVSKPAVPLEVPDMVYGVYRIYIYTYLSIFICIFIYQSTDKQTNVYVHLVWSPHRRKTAWTWKKAADKMIIICSIVPSSALLYLL